MNAKKLACAPEDIDIHELWSKIDWDKCECFVQKLQARIVKAQREGRHNKVKALQWMLTHSFYAKALAVKRVTTNKGKSTSGVDKITWSSPLAKAKAIFTLKRRGGKSSVRCPLKPKRFYPLKIFNNAPSKSLDRWGYYYFSLFPSVCRHLPDTFSV